MFLAGSSNLAIAGNEVYIEQVNGSNNYANITQEGSNNNISVNQDAGSFNYLECKQFSGENNLEAIQVSEAGFNFIYSIQGGGYDVSFSQHSEFSNMAIVMDNIVIKSSGTYSYLDSIAHSLSISLPPITDNFSAPLDSNITYPKVTFSNGSLSFK
mgnify:CR=1 FL=1